jgi:hypothetical protein
MGEEVGGEWILCIPFDWLVAYFWVLEKNRALTSSRHLGKKVNLK